MTTLMSRLFIDPMVKARATQTGSLLATRERAPLSAEYKEHLIKLTQAERNEMFSAEPVPLNAAESAAQAFRPEYNTQGPWCCSEGQRLRLFVLCAECGEVSALYSAAMAPVRGDEA